MRKILYFLLIIFIGAAGFTGGQLYEKSESPVCAPEPVDLSLFWQSWNLLKEQFVSSQDLDNQNMVYGAISGMVKSLEDPYTVFFPPQETKKFLEDVSGSFEGVGMEIGIRKGQLQVIAPLEGTPAMKSGFRSGDKIIQINGESTIDITIDEAVNRIRGPKGEAVILTVFRDEWDKTKDIEVVRGVIAIPSLDWGIVGEDGEEQGPVQLIGEDIAHIKLYHFTEKAMTDFNKAALEILQSKASKIILDLRNNPGGYLEVAQGIAGWFLEKGQLVAIEDFGATTKDYKAMGNSKLLDYPIVVLMNQGSASGSEILAGALRDNRGVKLIGAKSFGKGSVQQLEKLRDGSSLKITVARWLTPNGQLIHEKGLEPDVEVELTDEDYEKELDPQLDKALEIIENLE